jgi:hypothetical protein
MGMAEQICQGETGGAGKRFPTGKGRLRRAAGRGRSANFGSGMLRP